MVTLHNTLCCPPLIGYTLRRVGERPITEPIVDSVTILVLMAKNYTRVCDVEYYAFFFGFVFLFSFPNSFSLAAVTIITLLSHPSSFSIPFLPFHHLRITFPFLFLSLPFIIRDFLLFFSLSISSTFSLNLFRWIFSPFSFPFL